MEGTKAGVPNVTKSVSTEAYCYFRADPGTCRDGAEEERWTQNASGITSQQHQLLIFRFLGHDVNPLNLSTDTTKSPPCLTDDKHSPKNRAELKRPTK